MSETRVMSAEVPPEMAGRRLDQALSELFPEYSRSRLKKWVDEGHVQVNGRVLRPKDKLAGGESLTVEVLPERDERHAPEPIPLRIVYEDDQILVIDKPAGLVVHPAAGNWAGTLLNALLHHVPELVNLPRAGIVHRLDKDTTGLMVVAKTLAAHTSLVEQLQERTMGREYEAVVQGEMIGGGKVEEPIGRHPKNRQKMAVVPNGKPAVTHYRVLERFSGFTHVRLKLETGRTHQIRVHMSHIHFPLVGDPLYGGRMKLPKGATPELQEFLSRFKRQALHAKRLQLCHPVGGELLEWEVPLPEDLIELLNVLRRETPL